jgi:hypothetical protein
MCGHYTPPSLRKLQWPRSGVDATIVVEAVTLRLLTTRPIQSQLIPNLIRPSLSSLDRVRNALWRLAYTQELS